MLETNNDFLPNAEFLTEHEGKKNEFNSDFVIEPRFKSQDDYEVEDIESPRDEKSSSEHSEHVIHDEDSLDLPD